MCLLNAFFARYFYLNTVLHLLAVSYERYKAIVRSPLTYNGDITKSSVMVIVLIWVIPMPISIGPFIGWGKYVYNPKVFFCQQGWATQSGSIGWRKGLIGTACFCIPLLIIVLLNWSVYKTAIVHANGVVIPIGSLSGSEMQRERTSRRRIETTTTTTTIYLYPRMIGKLQFTFYISRGYSLPKITIGAKKNGQTLCYIEY